MVSRLFVAVVTLTSTGSNSFFVVLFLVSVAGSEYRSGLGGVYMVISSWPLPPPPPSPLSLYLLLFLPVCLLPRLSLICKSTPTSTLSSVPFSTTDNNNKHKNNNNNIGNKYNAQSASPSLPHFARRHLIFCNQYIIFLFTRRL